jgi:hypothetical protein
MISWRMAAAWVAALVAATVLTWQIVGLADSQVGEGPVAVAPTLEITPDQPDSSTSTTAVSSTAASAPTTTTPGPTTSTSGDSSSPSTSSSTVVSAWSVRSVSSPGGVVVVRYRPGEVELQAATPLPGFAVEIDDAGPPRVRVEFESADSDVRVEIRWRDGALDISVDAD